uniref:Family with sequence similarity 107 member A n=1 Tax=Seriola dumerili TaxID=41447 RepID=A0A3B4V9K0_SERDU
MQAHQNEQEDRCPKLQAFIPPQLQSEEESVHLIRPRKPLSPLTASKSHQELHKELRMTHNRLDRLTHRKSELQQVLEKRKWDQKKKASRDQEEAKRNRSPFHQELLRRHHRLEKQREELEFLRVKERLRRTATLDAGEKEV